MTVLLPELGSVRLRATDCELVVEVDVPEEVDLPRLTARISAGVLEIRLPRVERPRERLVGFNPEASGV